MKGKFITFEGCEGVGKSTQIRLLQDYFKNNDYDAVFTREPGGVRICETIRGVILNKEYTSYIKDGMDSLQALNRVKEEHSEASDKFIEKISLFL